MKNITRRFVKGLAIVVPTGLTAYILYYMGAWAEHATRGFLLWATGIAVEDYVPGLGILAGLAAVFGLGLLADVWLFRWLVACGESLIMKIPLVRTIFGGLRDLMDFVSKASSGGMGGQTVTVDVGNGARLLGMVTRKDLESLPKGLGSQDEVAVYLPLSYQIGGFTVFFPKDRLRPVKMSTQDAMTFALTAGMSSAGRGNGRGEQAQDATADA